MNSLPRFALIAVLGVAACERPAERPIDPDAEPPVEYLAFGDPVSEEGPALAPGDLAADPASYHGQDVRVEGTIVEVCQRAGCWLALDNPVGPPVRVEVPRIDGEYAWTVPTDLGRLPAIVEGTAYADTLSIEDLRHFAEDAGRSPEQIAAIDEPQYAAHITARGMLVVEPAVPAPVEADGDARPGDHAEEQAQPEAEPAGVTAGRT